MNNIKEGQIWNRNPIPDTTLSWRVRILEVNKNTVTHECIEYNGREVSLDEPLREPVEMKIENFLEMYSL